METAMNDERLLSTKDVAKMLQVHPATVVAIAKRGELARLKLGHRTSRFARADVEAYIARHARPTQGPPRVLTVADMFAGLRSPDVGVRTAAALLLAHSIGAGLRLSGEHVEDVQHLIGPQVVDLLTRAATGDTAAVDALERHFVATPPGAARFAGATP